MSYYDFASIVEERYLIETNNFTEDDMENIRQLQTEDNYAWWYLAMVYIESDRNVKRARRFLEVTK